MRVLVTGGLGYVGRAVAAGLAHAGHDTVALTRRPERAGSDLPGEVIRGDITDPEQLSALLRAGRYDRICHLAARTAARESFTDPLAYWKTNLDGTWNLLHAMRAAATVHDRPIGLVFASTAAVYLPRDDARPLREDDPVGPTTPYAATKLAAEWLIDSSVAAHPDHLGAITLRVTAVAGATGNHGDPDLTRIVPKAVAVAAGHAPHVEVNGDGTAMRDLVHVADLAEAYLAALAVVGPGVHQIVNVGSGIGVEVREVLAAVERVTGRRVAVKHRPAAREQQRLVVDTTSAMEVLGWQARRSSIDEIVRDAWHAGPSR